jgi:multidrug resistance efflux pump
MSLFFFFFLDNLKALVAQFSMILEGEHRLDQARAHVTACEMKATKIRKELRKATRRGTGAEVQQLEIKLTQAENSFIQAQNEGL